MMPFESINPPQFPTPIAPYSAGTKAGNIVYVSGTLALGPGGTVLHPGDAEAQTRHVLKRSASRSKPPERRWPTWRSTTSS
jgi:aminoacrylate peracid reductase